MPLKPQHWWNTGIHVAQREQEPCSKRDLGPRAESFELRFEEGHRGYAHLGLGEQHVERESWARDPELAVAIRAWLIARGQRAMRVVDETGDLLCASAITPSDFDQVTRVQGPPRFVSLAPSNYDLLRELGLDGQGLLACEDSTTPQGEDCPERLGPDLNPDLDRALALSPSLVLASLTVPGMERVVVGLRRRKLPHLVFAPRGLDDVQADLERLGQAAGVDAGPACSRFASLRTKLAQDAARLVRPVRVFLEWWPRPQFSPGADCYSNELIALAGGVNVFGARSGSSLEVSAAEVAVQNPELAFVSWCGVHLDKLDPKRMASHPELAELDFVRQERIFPLDEALSGRPGPRVLLAAQAMAQPIAAYARDMGLLR